MIISVLFISIANESFDKNVVLCYFGSETKQILLASVYKLDISMFSHIFHCFF